MRKILLSLLAVASGLISFAKQVDEQTAKTVGYNFLKTSTHTAAPSMASALQLAYKLADANGNVYMYVFNTGANGFVIVSGDDIANPVLGYSGEVSFDANNIPPDVTYWLDGAKKDIATAIETATPATAAVKDKWSTLKVAAAPAAKATATAIIAPLCKTTWNQSPYYNYTCPFDNTQNAHAVTGCVATAMAQVMKYWNYPATGNGSHSYTPYSNPQYGTQSANFGATTYRWSAMTNAINNTSTGAIDTIMYHAGVSVNMDYGVDGSSAFVIQAASPITNCAEYALKSYFRYKSSLQGLYRNNYGTSQWMIILKTELNAGRPVIYAGFGTQGGHCWVLDGYDANDFVHLNWGWGGNSNGYFSVDAMDPAALGPGNGFDNDHEAIIGIQPNQPGVAMDLNATLSAPGTIAYNHPFSITTNIINHGTDIFNGDYIAHVFDENANLVDSIQLMTGNTLTAGNQTGTLTFHSNGSAAMTPGNYTIGIYYRPAGKSWMQVNDYASYTNLIPVTVGVATAVNEVKAATGVKLYPNPASDVINIAASNNITNVRISDLQGRVLSEQAVANQTSVSIAVNMLTTGIYFVQTTTTAGTQTDKLMIRK
jgi:hypothetical protein